MNYRDYLRAGRPSTPSIVLHNLALTTCPRIRARVAENQSIPLELLESLSRDENADVRIAVGANPSTPTIIRWVLAFDEHPDVRYSLAENANIPLIILSWLSGDENPYIAHRALKTINSLAKSNPKLHSLGDLNMAAKTIERTLRRMLSTKERLSKHDAIRLRKLILEDGYLSKSEKKIIRRALENDLLTEEAFEIFLQLLLDKYKGDSRAEKIA